MLAVKRLAALAAHTYLGIATTIHEHYSLFPGSGTGDQGIAQVGRHQYSLLLAHLPHIYRLHIWKACRRRALLQLQIL